MVFAGIAVAELTAVCAVVSLTLFDPANDQIFGRFQNEDGVTPGSTIGAVPKKSNRIATCR
jgi:hypothetical protein